MLIQILLVLVLAMTFFVTLKRARQGVIRWSEAIAWSVLWVVAAIVVLLPDTTSVVANLFGVGRGVDVVIYGAITLLFILVFKVFLSLDRMEKKLTDIVRKDALKDLEGKTHE
jgi:hypothetical protein